MDHKSAGEYSFGKLITLDFINPYENIMICFFFK